MYMSDRKDLSDWTSHIDKHIEFEEPIVETTVLEFDRDRSVKFNTFVGDISA